MAPVYYIAQANIARMKHALTDPQMREFKDALITINQLADESPGFVWRLQSDTTGDATDIRVLDDDLMLINLSVWKSIDEMMHFVYASRHVEFLQEKEKWFSKLDRPHVVLWWVPAGETPTAAQALEKLTHLQTHGTTAEAFTFKRIFPPVKTGRD